MSRHVRHTLSTAFRFGAIMGAVLLACACTVQIQPPASPDVSQPPAPVERSVVVPQPAAPPPPVVTAPQGQEWWGTTDCSILADNGLTFDEVNSYWAALGYPSNMDNENDGIPCETIYGEQN